MNVLFTVTCNESDLSDFTKGQDYEVLHISFAANMSEHTGEHFFMLLGDSKEFATLPAFFFSKLTKLDKALK
jgi:hypothetical protein